MTDLEPNIQAYRTMTEVLVGFRKIFQRGLERVAGETWYLDSCPPGVYERLMERRESELAVERLTGDYDDVMSFTTFGDLAEIVEYNDELARLLRNLAPSRDVLVARLSELEALRAKLAMARDLSDDELSVLTSYSGHLRRTLRNARTRSRDAEVGTVGDAVPEATEPEAVGEPAVALPRAAAVPSRVGAGAAPARAHDEDRIAAVPDEGEAGAREAAREVLPVAASAAPVEVGPAEEAVEEEPPDELVDLEPPEASAAARRLIRVDPEALAAEIGSALAAGEEKQVLRLLRREIIAVAESMYRLNDEIVRRGWDGLKGSSWFEERRGRLGLEPLADFHRLVDDYRSRQRDGAPADELRGLLVARDLSGLLLRLREVFLANGV